MSLVDLQSWKFNKTPVPELRDFLELGPDMFACLIRETAEQLAGPTGLIRIINRAGQSIKEIPTKCCADCKGVKELHRLALDALLVHCRCGGENKTSLKTWLLDDKVKYEQVAPPNLKGVVSFQVLESGEYAMILDHPSKIHVYNPRTKNNFTAHYSHPYSTFCKILGSSNSTIFYIAATDRDLGLHRWSLVSNQGTSVELSANETTSYKYSCILSDSIVAIGEAHIDYTGNAIWLVDFDRNSTTKLQNVVERHPDHTLESGKKWCPANPYILTALAKGPDNTLVAVYGERVDFWALDTYKLICSMPQGGETAVRLSELHLAISDEYGVLHVTNLKTRKIDYTVDFAQKAPPSTLKKVRTWAGYAYEELRMLRRTRKFTQASLSSILVNALWTHSSRERVMWMQKMKVLADGSLAYLWRDALHLFKKPVQHQRMAIPDLRDRSIVVSDEPVTIAAVIQFFTKFQLEMLQVATRERQKNLRISAGDRLRYHSCSHVGEYYQTLSMHLQDILTAVRLIRTGWLPNHIPVGKHHLEDMIHTGSHLPQQLHELLEALKHVVDLTDSEQVMEALKAIGAPIPFVSTAINLIAHALEFYQNRQRKQTLEGFKELLMLIPDLQDIGPITDMVAILATDRQMEYLESLPDQAGASTKAQTQAEKQALKDTEFFISQLIEQKPKLTRNDLPYQLAELFPKRKPLE